MDNKLAGWTLAPAGGRRLRRLTLGDTELGMLPEMTPQDRNAAFPWSRKCLQVLRTVLPKPLAGKHLMFGSDYSGDHRRSDYRVYGFLVADADNSLAYPQSRRAVRERYLSDGRRMSYKRLGDGVRQKALLPFLHAADTLDGLCCVFIIHKALERISTSQRSLSIWQDLYGLRGRWGKPAFEAMARISHFFCLLLGVASKPHQHITWISDQDEIAANNDRLDDVHQFAARIAGLYMDHPLGEFAMNTTAVDTGDCAFEDFVAVPDLIAGAFADIVTIWSKQPAWPNGGDLALAPDDSPAKANAISTWFCAQSPSLRRCAILIDRFDEDRFVVQHLDVTK